MAIRAPDGANKVYLFSQGQPITRLLAYVTGWSKSIVLENKVFLNFDFRIRHLDHPLQSHSKIYFGTF